MIHGHISAWLLALILFVVALFLHKGGKEKGAKIVKMILRVLYLLIIATGVGLLFSVYKIDVWYILKAVVGLWIIGLFEMILSRVANNRRTSVFWIQFVIAWVLVLYLGGRLPMSFLNP
ncbi:YisL family protein [Neobacillus drentensis]|uniref:YisL family protein n=1 Tax=Neobacillus drentensis TaxID=220684 RepID=UPI00285B98BC|nr:YisL family protein [Neobacillus drentensis]MDR7239909.1 energy-coupling factor transporter transmembrane protein EcfT [Neobacillus drentensis]